MNCSICKVKKISSTGGKTCGLECACKLNGDDYYVIMQRLLFAVFESKLACKNGTKGKV